MSAGKPQPLVAGNWKMNGLRASRAVLEAVVAGAADIGVVELLVCPPATLVGAFTDVARGTPVAIGGQDCHANPSGAYTGDIAASMLADLGAAYVIVGHSERRTLHGETDAIVRGKAEAAVHAGLVPIVCVGETQAQREEGRALEIVRAQIRGSVPPGSGARIVVAYEPVWAIGTGLVPSMADVAEMHGAIRRELGRVVEGAEAVRILYGGSVKPSNAAELLGIADVDGALVGGASLVAADFLAIARGCPTVT